MPNLGLKESSSQGLSKYIIFFHYIGLELDKNGLKEGRLTTFTATPFFCNRGYSIELCEYTSYSFFYDNLLLPRLLFATAMTLL